MNNLEQKLISRLLRVCCLIAIVLGRKLARLLADRNKLRFAELIAVLKAQIDSSCEKTRASCSATAWLVSPKSYLFHKNWQEIADAIKTSGSRDCR